MNKIKKTAKSTKNFVSRHRVGIAVTATAATAVYVQMKIAADWNEFLKEHGLLEEYYDFLEN